MIKITKKQKPYVTGFVVSTILTLTAYTLVVTTTFSGWTLFYIIIALAVIQLLVQVIFFLHLGREEKPHWKLMTFLFAVIVVLIVVIGSLWIMNNLDYRHGHSNEPAETDQYIIQDEGIRP